MNNDEFDVDIIYKIVLIGDSGVGKSNLISRFTKDEFNIESKATIGVEFATKILQMEDFMVKTQIWDTAGQEKYRAITSAYYRGAVGAIVVFDLTNQDSFDNLHKWMEQISSGASKNIVVMLVGNKSDMDDKRQVDHIQAQTFADNNGLTYIETSAMTSHNVEQSFHNIVHKIYKNGLQLNNNTQRDNKPNKTTNNTPISIDKKKHHNKKDCC